MKVKFRIFICLSISISILSSIINFKAYLMGHIPNIFQLIISITCLLTWMIVSIIFKSKKQNIFLKFCTKYFLVGLIIILIPGYLLNIDIIYILGIMLFVGPIYGIRYLIQIPSNIKLATIIICSTYLFIIIGYIIGLVNSKK